jgi:hypothetical protein
MEGGLVMKLHCDTLRPQELSVRQRTLMWELFDRYYVGITYESFTRDLLEKEQVFLLCDQDEVVGFNSLKFSTVAGHRVMYSGDMLIETGVRGMGSLPFVQAWARAMWKQCDWWCALASGPRTYRIPFLLFNRVTPDSNLDETPEETRLRHRFAQQEYGAAYSASEGVVQLQDAYVLREEHADIREGYPLEDFFKQRNPGWARGDEVVSLISTHPENWSVRAKRLLGDLLT